MRFTTAVLKTTQNVKKYAIFAYLVINSFNLLDYYVLQREKKRTSKIQFDTLSISMIKINFSSQKLSDGDARLRSCFICQKVEFNN